MTLVELLVAVGLASILILALMQLVQTSLSLLERSESRRDQGASSHALLEMVVRDLEGLEPGPRGDLWCDWRTFDTTADGIAGAAWPRLRLVRRSERLALARRNPATAEGLDRSGGLSEVVWLVLPDPDAGGPGPGVLWRGERLVGADGGSYLEAGSLDSVRPSTAGLERVGEGILWFGLSFAAETTLLGDGWQRGDELTDASGGWDAWRRGRSDPAFHPWNRPHPGMADPKGAPRLPRRVRLEIEIERPRDRLRRTFLTESVEPQDSLLRVDDPERLPRPGSLVLVGEEWLEVTRVDVSTVGVRRGQRGTKPQFHDVGEHVHFGHRAERSLPLSLRREGWEL